MKDGEASMNFLHGMNEVAIQKKVYRFIKSNFPMKRVLDNDDSFLENGILDSTGILDLMTFIEDRFEITIEDDEIIPDNLDSLEKLNVFINKKKV